MAFKIIKEGKKRIPVYRVNCSVCDCEFEFNKEDAEFGEDRDGKYLIVACPCCNSRNYSYKTTPYRYDIVER